MSNRQAARKHWHKSGYTLVEMLIALALLGAFSLMSIELLTKSSSFTASIGMRYSEANEMAALVNDLQVDLRQGAYISNNSHNQRLEYTTYDASGNAIKKIYLISGGNLMLSKDNGVTWNSPYRISSSTQYTLGSSSKFLYSGVTNNCTNFSDTNANGVYDAGDSAGSLVATCPYSSGTALTSPSQAYKIDLNNFQFSTGQGAPVAIRTFPTDLMISAPPGLVRSTSTPSSPAVKDPPLVQSFVTNTANSLYGTGFTIESLTFDPARDRLFIVGHGTAGTDNRIFVAERNGILNGAAKNPSTTTIQLDSVALDVNGYTILGLDATGKKLYSFDTSSGTSLATASTLDLASPSNLINSPKGIAYDYKTPTDFYIVGTDPSNSTLNIYERNKSTGALVGTAWTLPAAFDASHPPSGLAIEPSSGDFLVVRNYVNGSSPNKTIDIYRITRAGTSTYFSVNIDDLSSTATGITGNWGLGYDPILNRLFLSDTASNKVYEVVPNVLISPRS